ncbi:MAG: pilus assembly protein PilM [Verrucomicrobiota bacterium]
MADRTQLIEGLLKRFGLRRETRPRMPSQVTALDLEGLTLRVVQTRARGAIGQVVSGVLDLAPEADRNDPTIMGAALRRTLNRLGIRPTAVVMGVPRARVVLRTLTVPEIGRVDELASLVHFQIAKDLPFRLEDAVIDFRVLRRIVATTETPVEKEPILAPEGAGATKVEVLAAVVRRDEVDSYQRLAEAAGFRLVGLGLLPDANARCIQACRLEASQDATALVTIRPEEVGIDIVADGALRFSRGGALRPSGDTASSDSWVGSAAIEVVRTLHSYGGMGIEAPIGRILVAGCTGQEAAVVEALASRTPTPCTVLDPGTALKLPADLHKESAGAVAPIGLALGVGDADGLPLDFVNPKRPAVPRDYRRLALLGGTAAVVVLLVGVLGTRSWLLNRRNAVLQAVNAELADAEKKRPVYQKLTRQTAVVEDWVRGERDWLDHYAYLTSVLPPSEEIYLGSIAVTGQNAIRLAVQARSGETLARLEKQLVAAGYEVKPIAITPGADRFGYEFRSNVEVLVPAKLKIDLHKVKPSARPIDDVSLDTAAWKKGVQ